MSEITQADVNKAIKKCYWRKEVAGVSICAGNCVPCFQAINSGKCEALRKLLNKTATKRGDENE